MPVLGDLCGSTYGQVVKRDLTYIYCFQFQHIMLALDNYYKTLFLFKSYITTGKFNIEAINHSNYGFILYAVA